jgi:hypothetical protein
MFGKCSAWCSTSGRNARLIPTVALLRDCVAEAHKDKETDEYTEKKLQELADFFDTTTAWYGQIRQWPTGALTKFVKAGDKIRKLLGIGG